MAPSFTAISSSVALEYAALTEAMNSSSMRLMISTWRGRSSSMSSRGHFSSASGMTVWLCTPQSWR